MRGAEARRHTRLEVPFFTVLVKLLTRGVRPLAQAHLHEDAIKYGMAEQNLALALALADRIFILDKGHVRFSGSVDTFEADESLRQEYLTV